MASPVRELNLARLLERLSEDDGDALEDLFQQERGPLTRMFYGLCRCSATSEDLVQGTFLALWRYRANYRGGKATSYLYRIAINQWRRVNARDRRKKEVFQAYAPSREEAVVDPEDPIQREEAKAAVWRAIDELPSAQRETFVLHRFEGMSCPQIADMIDKPVKTVESRLRLALEKLTEKLQKRERLS